MKYGKVGLVVAAVVLSVSSAAFAQGSAAGAWEVTIDTPQGPNTSTLTLKQDGDKLTGDLASQMGSTPVTGTFTAGVVAVTANIDMQGMALQPGFSGKPEGNTFNGTVKLGDFGECPFTGKRAGATTAAAAPVAPAAARPAPAAASSGSGLTGKWDLVLTIPSVGEFPVTAEF